MTINPSEPREGLADNDRRGNQALRRGSSYFLKSLLDTPNNMIYSYLTKFERQNMNIQFDTNSTNAVEVRGLIALLSALFPSVNGHAQSDAPSTLTERLKASLALEDTQAPGPVLVEPSIQLSAVTEATKRTRRTKEQIAADEAAKQTSQAAPAAEVPVATQQVNGVLKTISADELRALLNGYIARHSMEEAIDKLKSFGCNRVTEALALESAKLNELAATLNG